MMYSIVYSLDPSREIARVRTWDSVTAWLRLCARRYVDAYVVQL